MIFAFFDFETTDKDPKTARITELGVALYSEKGKMHYAYSSTLYDESYPPIHAEASKITGIDDGHLKKWGRSPTFELSVLCDCLYSADFIVGHNIRNFDLPLLAEELKRVEIDDEYTKKPSIDTRYDIEYPEHLDIRKLPYLALEHGIIAQNSHAALSDVMTTASLFFKYDIEKTIARASSPTIFIQADVNFNTRDLAKERKYMWDGEKKIWVKEIKLCDYEKEERQTTKFKITKLENYERKA